jgi:broad specificity phosphatase PhoE
MKLNNKYYLLRHGEAVSNVENIVSCWPEKIKNPLTADGISKIKKQAEELKNKNIDLIFASPLQRTKETAEIVGDALGIKVKHDKRLREIGFGTYNGKTVSEFLNYFNEGLANRIKNKTPKGENYVDVTKRVFDFLKEINSKYKGKNILIVSHQAPILLLRAKVENTNDLKDVKELKEILGEKKITKGELIELN